MTLSSRRSIDRLLRVSVLTVLLHLSDGAHSVSAATRGVVTAASLGDRELDAAGVRQMVGGTSSSVSGPVLLYLWSGFALPVPPGVSRDSSAAFRMATGLDLSPPRGTLAGTSSGGAFAMATARGGAVPGLAARDSSAPAPIYLAGEFRLPRAGVSGALAGSAFPVTLAAGYQGTPAGNVSIGTAPSFGAYLAPGYSLNAVGQAAAWQGGPFSLRLSAVGEPGLSAALASSAFDLYSAQGFRRYAPGGSGALAASAFPMRSMAPFASGDSVRTGIGQSSAFSGYLTGNFMPAAPARAGELTGSAFVLRLLALADGRSGIGVSPPFPLALGGGPVAVAVSLVRAEFADGVAHVSWRLHDHEGGYSVERALTPDEWSELGQYLPDGQGEIAVEDRDVMAGQRYGYRIAGKDPSRAGLGEVWVEVPLFKLGMTGATPNPARLGQLLVSFVLPDREPARLEVLDVAGRLVASHDVGALGPGSHVFDASRGIRFSPGVYFLRLVRTERALVKKATVTN